MQTDYKKKINALILAAGFGTRLKPYTLVKAKPAIEFYGIPTIYFSIFPLLDLKIEKLFVNLHHLPQTVMDVVDPVVPPEISLNYSMETPEILGSAGAIGQIKGELLGSDQLIVINGDNTILYFDEVIKKLSDLQIKTRHFAELLLTPHAEAGKGLSSAWVDSEGYVVGFGVDSPQANCSPYHFLGAIAFDQQSFSHFEARFTNTLYDVIVPAIKTGAKVGALIAKNIFFHETGNIKDYTFAHLIVQQALASNPSYRSYFNQMIVKLGLNLELKIGPLQAPTHSYEIDDGSVVILPRDFRSDFQIRFSGFVGLSSGSTVSEQKRIKNTVVSSGQTLGPNHIFTDCLVLEQP